MMSKVSSREDKEEVREARRIGNFIANGVYRTKPYRRQLWSASAVGSESLSAIQFYFTWWPRNEGKSQLPQLNKANIGTCMYMYVL